MPGEVKGEGQVKEERILFGGNGRPKAGPLQSQGVCTRAWSHEHVIRRGLVEGPMKGEILPSQTSGEQ